MVLAVNPFCIMCEEQGYTVPATQVDHIIPKESGGTDALENLQGLCTEHHRIKTARERQWHVRYGEGSIVPVTIVSGSPGSGKTTWVMAHKRDGDLIVDFDALYMALSGLPWYDRPSVLMPFVAEARDAVIGRLSRHSQVRHAWIITSESSKAKLKQMAQQLRPNDPTDATVVVMDVGMNECLKRIANDERRKDKYSEWEPVVRDWYRKFESEA
jgi:hypothetical protein